MVELLEDINALNSVIVTLSNGTPNKEKYIAVNAIKAIVSEKEKQFNNAEARFLLDEMEYTVNEC